MSCVGEGSSKWNWETETVSGAIDDTGRALYAYRLASCNGEIAGILYLLSISIALACSVSAVGCTKVDCDPRVPWDGRRKALVSL